MPQVDLAIIGGGIVGLATALRCLQRFPGRQIVVFEKESLVAQHQTGHNSGVLHSGIYYVPGSLKATNCRLGKQAMEAFCREEGIAYEICGKVIVATREDEFPALERIFSRGQQNGVACELIGPERLAELEPHAAGLRAIHVPETGIVDYVAVGQRMLQRIESLGGHVRTGTRVLRVESPSDTLPQRIDTTAGAWEATTVINCAGLHSDRVARQAGLSPDAQIVPFRGEYYQLQPGAYKYCRNLIYPVPDPNFPFLGVHFTRMIDGTVECGPNAVLAFAREGYHKLEFNFRDLRETLTYRGFWLLAARYWRMGAMEMWRSFSKAAFLRALQRLIPAIRVHDLLPAPAGVRAQAVAPSGAMVDDFLIVERPRQIHVCNAPSPAATSSLQIGQTIVERLAARSVL